MQCRMNQVKVNDVPKFLKSQPSNDDHAVIIPHDALGPKRIPLSLHGIISYFPTRKPSKQEYEQSEDHYKLTGESPEWDPSSPSFSKQESLLLDLRGLVVESITSDHHKRMDELRQIFQLHSIAQDQNKEATLAEALQHRRREIDSCTMLLRSSAHKDF